MTNIYEFLKRNIERVSVIIIIISFISPFLFTKFFTGFLVTGQIGDTIGGLVSPFLNLLSIILLYLTLREQTEGSKITKDFDTITKMLDSTKQDFENLDFFPTKGSVDSYKGTRALFGMANTIKNCTDISTCLDESSLKAFQLSFTLFISNLTRTLQKNNNSSINLDDKVEFYENLLLYKTPIEMICDLCEDYYKRKQNVNQLDKTVGLLSVIKIALNSEYEKNKPK